MLANIPSRPRQSLTSSCIRRYRQAAHYNVTHLRRQAYYSLPSDQIDLLSSPPFELPKTFNAVDDALDANADLAEAILATGLALNGIDPEHAYWKGRATSNDMDKASSTLKQFYRDWSTEGLPERNASYSPIFAALEGYLPPARTSQRHRYRVLVPGAGLGRLVLDLCAAGYTVEGNEISYHQLVASNYVLNCTKRVREHTLYPWAQSFNNHMTRADQLRPVPVPDVHPKAQLEKLTAKSSGADYSARMSMTAGDFIPLYSQVEYADSFDAVTTCFFIDTAPNVMSYIRTVRHCLNPDGIWVNLGPLLWHFEPKTTPPGEDSHGRDSAQNRSNSRLQGSRHAEPEDQGIGEPGSFELSNDEVLALVEHSGFDILEQKEAPATGYIQHPASMLQNVYRPAFWVARKRLESSTVSP